MKYQLVLQFFAESLRDYDALIALEERLTGALEPTHVVDGHDFGSGEMNIFVDSDDPAAAFATAKGLIPTEVLGRSLRAAYREMAGNDYSVVWPPGSAARFGVK